jgi:hypothetical protein
LQSKSCAPGRTVPRLAIALAAFLLPLLLVSPTFAETVQIGVLTPKDFNMFANIGTAVEVEGTTAVFSAPGMFPFDAPSPDHDIPGIVYIYEPGPSGSGPWRQVRRLRPDGLSSEDFGQALSLDGDLLAVGAASFDERGELGSVYLFERNRGGADQWGRVTRIPAPDDASLEGGDGFGSSVVLSGNRLIVGAFGANAAGENSGMVYVYEQQGGPESWSLVQRLAAPDPAADEFFGERLALEGDTLAVAAPGAEEVDLFENRGGPEPWHFVTRLVSPEPAAEGFASQVALSGPTLAVHAWKSGAVYFFERGSDGGTWVPGARLKDHEAASVALDGDVAVVGSKSVSGSYFLYVLERNKGGLNRWGIVSTPTLPVMSWLTTAAIDGRLILMGSPFHGSDPEASLGRVVLLEHLPEIATVPALDTVGLAALALLLAGLALRRLKGSKSPTARSA